MTGQHGGSSGDEGNQMKWLVLAGKPRLDGGVTFSSTLNMRAVHQNGTFGRASRMFVLCLLILFFMMGMTSVASCLEMEVTLGSATRLSSCLL